MDSITEMTVDLDTPWLELTAGKLSRLGHINVEI
jgi:hypothetical protein